MNTNLAKVREQPSVDIIVADSESMTLKSIRNILDPVGSVTTVESQQAMLAMLRLNKYDVVIFGFEFENNIDNVSTINAIKKIDSSIKIIKILYQDDALNVRCLLNFGAQGFIRIGDIRTEALREKTDRLLAKEFYLDEAISSLLIQDEINPLHQKLRARLTKRECEVVLRLFGGDTVTEVALKTNRSVKTVSGQKISAMKKLDTKNNFELFSLLSTYSQRS